MGSIERIPPWATDAGAGEHGRWAWIDVGTEFHIFHWIEPGSFMMGSPKTERHRDSDETQHMVVLTKGFWLGKTACDQSQWESIMGSNPSHFKGPLRPVENVSWNDVQEFLKRLNLTVPDLNARLPTEAEWEYACRAGTTTPFSFGKTISKDQSNHDPWRRQVIEELGHAGRLHTGTADALDFPCNDWGLHQMHGNVWEWCQDFYAPYPAYTVVDPVGPASGNQRVARGGSWDFYGRYCRSASRYCLKQDSRNCSLGFRICVPESL